jgi:hypothetical protein
LAQVDVTPTSFFAGRRHIDLNESGRTRRSPAPARVGGPQDHHMHPTPHTRHGLHQREGSL